MTSNLSLRTSSSTSLAFVVSNAGRYTNSFGTVGWLDDGVRSSEVAEEGTECSVGVQFVPMFRVEI